MTTTILKISLIIWVLLPSEESVRSFRLEGRAQGTTWHTTYYAGDSLVSKRQIDSILDVIDSSLSLYKPYSTIVAFNKSTSGVAIDSHFVKVVKKSLEIWNETGGLSDITVAPLVEAWGFGVKAGNQTPSEDTIHSILRCVGSDRIRLKGNFLEKLDPCVKIDVNGIAQGYSVDVIADFFEKKGIRDYLIELGGELRVKGKKQPGAQMFRVGIESPAADDFTLPPMQKVVSLQDGAITTSGSYRKFHESKGRSVSHIIHPKNGQPVSTDLISVTVFGSDAITADAYDNALMLMGLDSAVRFVERKKDLGAFFIYKNSQGVIADSATSRFKKLIQQ